MEKTEASNRLLEFIAEHDVEIVALAALGSAIAAILAIITTIIVAKTQIQNSRLTVRPIGQFSIGDYENEIFVSLSNKGVGPLFIDEMIYQFDDGEKISNASLVSLLPSLPDGIAWKDFSSLSSGTVVSPQSSRTLVKLGIGSDFGVDVDIANEIRRKLGSLTITCKYKDVYNRGLPPTSKKLDWFARRFED